jgi:hypothetical protein
VILFVILFTHWIKVLLHKEEELLKKLKIIVHAKLDFNSYGKNDLTFFKDGMWIIKKGFSIMCKVAYVKKFKIVTLN